MDAAVDCASQRMVTVPAQVVAQERGVPPPYRRTGTHTVNGRLRRSEVAAATVQAAPVGPSATVRVAEDLVTTLAHDLNNHLTSLLLLLTRVKLRANREQRSDYDHDIELALRVSDRLHALVVDLLDTARLREGLLAVSTERVDLVALLQQCAALFETGDHPIALRILAPEAGAEAVVVQGDPRRLRQVFENLLANAVKHSPPGAAIMLTIESDRSSSPDVLDAPPVVEGQVCVSVADHGPGIAPQLLPYIFDRFVAGPQSNGLGLGLYLAREIARAHGGELTVNSISGAGARFSLTLPLAPPAALA